MRALLLLAGVAAACGSSDAKAPAQDAGLDVASDTALDTGTIDCSRVGCAPPPLCSTGCTEPCGCCACGDGTTRGGLVCSGGCWEPADAAGD